MGYTAAAMLVDGKAIAASIYTELASEVAQLSAAPRMAIITCAPNFETTKYLELKRKKADQVGIALTIIELPETAITADFLDCIASVTPNVDGIVVQLPLPPQVDKAAVLAAIPATQDPDGLNGGAVLPPVVGAIEAIATQAAFDWTGKSVAVVGNGRLVGQPAASYAKAAGANVMVLTETSPQFIESLQAADVIISGAGQPDFIKAHMVSEGVVVFDAGTSEDGGQLKGDVAPTVAKKAALFTPVPGGIGPITIAVLLRNVVLLAQRQ